MLTEVFIIEPDPIIRADLVELASEDLGIARVHGIEDMGVVASVLLTAGNTSCILVNGDKAGDESSVGPSLVAAATRGARIIVLGSEKVLPFPADFVDVPFTSDMIVAALGGLGPDADTNRSAE